MTTLLFHKDVFAPAALFRSPGAIRVKYTRHARESAEDDRYGNLSAHLKDWVDMDEAEIVEVEVRDREITKRVVRVHADEKLDLVMVIQADGLVRTVWGNLHDDTHKTLDRSKFVHNPAKNAH